MKKSEIMIVIMLLALAFILPLFAQQGQPPRGGFRGFRESQMQAIETIEKELAKMKAPQEGMPPNREAWQNLSDDERQALRERFRTMREEREKSITLLEEQIAKLKGSRALTAEYDESLEKLQAIKDLAVKEEAKETAAQIEKLIAEKKTAFEEMMNKLGLEPRRGRGGRPPRQPGSTN